MAEYSGTINYATAEATDSKVKLKLQCYVQMTRGMLEEPVNPIWNTIWRVYDPYSRLLWEDTRLHSLMPFNRGDTAVDEVAITIAAKSYYHVVLLGKFGGGDEEEIDREKVIVGEVPEPTPPPEPVPPKPPPKPVPPKPIPPTPVPPECRTDAECLEGYVCQDGVCILKEKAEIPWLWLAIIAVGALIVLAPSGKKPPKEGGKVA